MDELPGASNGYVPHHLPSDTAHIEEFSRKNGVPLEGARGGADTTYPEYAVKVLQRSAAETDRLNRAALEAPRSENHRRAAAPNPVTGDIRVVPVQGNVYLLAGAGGNMAVQIGEDGVLLVDTGAGTLTDKVLAAIRQLSDKPIRFILNTNAKPDRMGGNASLAVAGRRGGRGPTCRQRRARRDDDGPRGGAARGERRGRTTWRHAGRRVADRHLLG